MISLDPKVLFALIAHHLPRELHDHVLIVGSCGYRAIVNTQIAAS